MLTCIFEFTGFLSEVDKTLNSDNDNNSNSNVNEWSVEQGNLGQFVTPIIKRLNSQSKINNRGWILVASMVLERGKVYIYLLLTNSCSILFY